MSECDKNGCKVNAADAETVETVKPSGCPASQECCTTKGCVSKAIKESYKNSADAFDSCHKKFGDIEEFRVALAKFAESAQLNMSEKWREITEALWKNSQCCTCRVGNFMCPCEEGIAEAKKGGDCYCRLFYGHN